MVGASLLWLRVGKGCAVGPHADDVVSAPLGAALLDRLEHAARRRRDPEWFEPFNALPDTRDDDVAAAADWVGEAGSSQVLSFVLEAGDLVGPWHGSGPSERGAGDGARTTPGRDRDRPARTGRRPTGAGSHGDRAVVVDRLLATDRPVHRRSRAARAALRLGDRAGRRDLDHLSGRPCTRR
jgi:hypothetical protein